MVKDKDSSSSPQVKKKRKTAANENEPQVDIYQKMCELELEEAKKCNVVKDSERYSHLLNQIREILQMVFDFKCSEKANSSDKKEQLSVYMNAIGLGIMEVKHLNRTDKNKQVLEREQLEVEKKKCDTIKLNCENLVYELYHLMKEVNKCVKFKSEHESIELVSLEEFMSGAPKEVTRKFKKIDKNNMEQDHLLKMARLEWELTQCKNMSQRCQELEQQKELIMNEINELKDEYSSYLPLLTDVANSCKPLQEKLGMGCCGQEHANAQLLPDPLYVLYANIIAYKTVYATTLTITIVGDRDEAVQFNEALEVSKSNGSNEDDSESETELPEVEEIVEVKRKKHRKSTHHSEVSQTVSWEDHRKKMLETHPLKVEMTIFIDDGPKMVIHFSYHTKLKIVTVSSDVEVSASITLNTAKEILTGSNILGDLVENDTGLESPNPSIGFLLKKYETHSFAVLVTQIGYAYKWAQTMCGIEFMPTKRLTDADIQPQIEFILKTLRKRLMRRFDLAKQLEKLEQGILPDIPDSIKIPTNHISSISKWISTTYQNFCQSKIGHPLLDEEIVASTDLFYLTKITRPDATLDCFVVIKNTYPVIAPIFVLNLEYQGQQTALNCDDIRDMERCINLTETSSKSSSFLLSLQLHKLCSLFDVYMATLTDGEGQSNVKFIKSVSGRNLRRPFKFNSVGSGIYTQF